MKEEAGAGDVSEGYQGEDAWCMKHKPASPGLASLQPSLFDDEAAAVYCVWNNMQK